MKTLGHRAMITACRIDVKSVSSSELYIAVVCINKCWVIDGKTIVIVL